jgi:hypothetical protein
MRIRGLYIEKALMLAVVVYMHGIIMFDYESMVTSSRRGVIKDHFVGPINLGSPNTPGARLYITRDEL